MRAMHAALHACDACNLKSPGNTSKKTKNNDLLKTERIKKTIQADWGPIFYILTWQEGRFTPLPPVGCAIVCVRSKASNKIEACERLRRRAAQFHVLVAAERSQVSCSFTHDVFRCVDLLASQYSGYSPLSGDEVSKFLCGTAVGVPSNGICRSQTHFGCTRGHNVGCTRGHNAEKRNVGTHAKNSCFQKHFALSFKSVLIWSSMHFHCTTNKNEKCGNAVTTRSRPTTPLGAPIPLPLCALSWSWACHCGSRPTAQGISNLPVNTLEQRWKVNEKLLRAALSKNKNAEQTKLDAFKQIFQTYSWKGTKSRLPAHQTSDWSDWPSSFCSI